MVPAEISRLAPREREIAGIIYAKGEACAVEVGAALSDPISNAAIRSMLGRLVGKGLLRRRKSGKKFIYSPAASNEAARHAALRRVSREYFGGSLGEMADWAASLARPGKAGIFSPG